MKENKLKIKALAQNIPIIEDESLFFIINFIKENNVKTILEIGTGIAYSAIMMAEHVNHITTIEREPNLFKEATSNVIQYNLNDKIKLINADALNINISENYDLIFIDGAKAQYRRFFEKYANNLPSNGVIICDNLNFHNLDINKVSKSTKQLIRKLNEFKVFLKDNNNYKTEFLNIGDGLSISRRIKWNI